MGPGRRALGADWGNSFLTPGSLRGFLEAMCLEEVEGFHSHKNALAEGRPRSPRQRQKWSVATPEGSGAQNSPCCSSREQGVSRGGTQGKETTQDCPGKWGENPLLRGPGQPQKGFHFCLPSVTLDRTGLLWVPWLGINCFIT